MATTYTKSREIYRMATTLATVYAFANSYEVLKYLMKEGTCFTSELANSL